MDNIFFNAHHSPVGAYATFTLGFNGKKGGFGLESGIFPHQNVYIGLESDIEHIYKTFPFNDMSIEEDENTVPFMSHFNSSEITREYNIGTDTWEAENIRFTIFTPSYGIPDPKTASDSEMKKTVIPAIFAEMTIDNTDNDKSRKAFFCYERDYPNCGFRHLDNSGESSLKGIADGRVMAIATNNENAFSVIDYSMFSILDRDLLNNDTFCWGYSGGIVMEIPAGKKETFHFALCFYKEGIISSGLETKYYYTNYFKNLEDVVQYALTHMNTYIDDAMKRDEEINKQNLSDEQKFQLCHAIKSYYGNTQLLEYEGNPLWIVNEGEYRAMNTLDLAIDQMFYELRMNSWVVKNILEMFVKRYSYVDQINFNGKSYFGGRSFAHDMGVANAFSAEGCSSYERKNMGGPWSYMTCEQLLNWILCATVYISYTKDYDFGQKYKIIFIECFESLLNRDHPFPSERNGLMSFDTSKTVNGKEITTYDSLDASIGQARNSAYLGVKTWAAYLALDKFFERNDLKVLSEKAHSQAKLCAQTISNQMNSEGFIPGVLFEDNNSKVIPIIEGLIYPYYTNNREVLKEEGEFGDFIKALKKHLNTVLVKGSCLFEDGGWKLSSSSTNSWLSKIYLCQFVARKILNLQCDEINTIADRAHVKWLLHPELSYWCFSDQIHEGVIQESKYYPRGVTSILWLEE